jgi:septal ring-binding cell division protein DamX
MEITMASRNDNTIMIGILIFLVIALLISACSENEEESSKQELTQRQRDSVLAETGLPGAELVGTALEAADTAEARAKSLDELSK